MLRYRQLVEMKAKCFYVAGADHDDVVQEGMIGLFKAIRDFRSDVKARFRQFAELCVTRQIITAVKTATRQKHALLNGYLPLERGFSGEDGEGALIETIPDTRGVNPEEIVLNPPMHLQIRRTIWPLLSEFERSVLKRYLESKSYKQIALDLQCRPKSVDNALQRIKRKLQKVLHST